MNAITKNNEIIITISEEDLVAIIENPYRWNGLKITNMKKLVKKLAKKIIQEFQEDEVGDFSPIEKAVEDTAYELYGNGEDCVKPFDEENDEESE